MLISAQTTAKALPGKLLRPRVWFQAAAPGSRGARPLPRPRGLTPTAHEAVFLWAIPVSRSQSHQEPISEEALEGSSAFLGSCSAGRGFKGTGDGSPAHLFSSLRDPTFLGPTRSAAPSRGALVTETGFLWLWFFSTNHPNMLDAEVVKGVKCTYPPSVLTRGPSLQLPGDPSQLEPRSPGTHQSHTTTTNDNSSGSGGCHSRGTS